MADLCLSDEALREKLLDQVWAGASAGLGAMLLDEEKIRQAGPEELLALARQYGIK